MELLEEFINETKIIIRIFEIKKTELINHHNNCNIARTVGTTVATAGGSLIIGALLLAPITGGASIVGLTGLGTALGIGGAVVNIGTEVVDFFSSKEFTKQIAEYFETRNEIGEKLHDYFKNIEEINKKLIDDGMNEDEAAANATFMVFQRGMTGANFARLHNLGSLYNAGSASTFAFRTGGQFWRSMRLQSLAVRKLLTNLGINVSRKTAMNIIRTGTVVLSTVFVFFDVKSLIDNWKEKHPNLKQVEDLIESMKNQLNNLIPLYEWLKSENLNEKNKS